MTIIKAGKKISIVIPVYNEGKNIENTYKSIKKVLAGLSGKLGHEMVFVDDGSRDNSVEIITKLAKKDNSIKLVKFSKNFGKEIATTAGLHHASGDAVLMIDADGQHPPELITEFVNKWEKGNKLVIGVRTENQKEGFVKKNGSKIFYKLFNSTSGNNLIPGSTDFRLLDREVVDKFSTLTERNRITRGLIDWLGEKPEIVHFKANARTEGEAGYKFSKLAKLALTSFLSLSFKPLYLVGYLGLVITPLSLIAGLFLFIQDVLLNDPLSLDVTGSGYLGVGIVFLVGLLLITQGLLAIYISYIYEEVRNRPLYVIDEVKSII